MTSAPRSPGSPRVLRRVFDGLFVHGRRPDPELAAELRAHGYDPDAAADSYPLDVYIACLDAARRRWFGDVPPAEGLRLLGRLFVDGFRHTVVGAVFAAAAPLLGPDRVILRLPRYLTSARDGMTLDLHAAGERAWHLRFDEDRPRPDYMVGLLEAIVEIAGGIPDVRVVQVDAGSFEMSVKWTPWR